VSTLEFGSISVTPMLDSSIRVPGDHLMRVGAAHFPVLPGHRGLAAEDWAAHPEHLDADGLFHMHFGGYLVRGIGDRVILVDLGVGPSPFVPPGLPAPHSGVLIESLRRHGVEPVDVTDVVLTHLHLDHIGWASVDGVPVFGNATYRCALQDWDVACAGDGPVLDLLGPIRDRLEPWDSHTTLFPGFDVQVLPGHTPGSSAIVVSSGASRAFLVGDIAHCPHELMFTDWVGMGDSDAVQAERSRQDLADEIERSGAWMGSTHFAGLALGRLTRQGNDRAFVYDVQERDESGRAARA
jgi:glyoxylase-like metal-dependent hydrolase (beta-lactamase superfamily II)